MNISTKEYLDRVREEHKSGYVEGYAAAWDEIQKIIQEAAFEAGIQASIKRKEDKI